MKVPRTVARIARWSLRVVSALAILATTAVLAARSDRAGRYAAGRMAAALQSSTGRPARVGGSALSVFPPGIQVRGVEIARGDGSLDQPVLGARGLRLDGRGLPAQGGR